MSLTKSLALELGDAAHPRQLHRARRHPDAGHRCGHAREDAAAGRRSRRRRRRRGDLPRVGSRAVRDGHDDSRRRRKSRGRRLGSRRVTEVGPPRENPRPKEQIREVRHRARRAQPALSSRRDDGGRSARLRVGMAAGAPRSSRVRCRVRRTRARTIRPSRPTRRSTTRSRTSASSRARPSACDSAPTCSTSGSAIRSPPRAVCRPSTCSRAVASSSVSARRGSKRNGTRPSSTSRRAVVGSTRRSNLQAPLHRGDDLASRRVLRLRRGRVRAQAGAEAVAADPRRRRIEGCAPAGGTFVRRLDRHGAHVRVGRGADRDAPHDAGRVRTRRRPVPDASRRSRSRRSTTCGAGRRSV